MALPTFSEAAIRWQLDRLSMTRDASGHWIDGEPTRADAIAALDGACNDADGICEHCGRNNAGYEFEPCSDDCPRYHEAQGVAA